MAYLPCNAQSTNLTQEKKKKPVKPHKPIDWESQNYLPLICRCKKLSYDYDNPSKAANWSGQSLIRPESMLYFNEL